MEISMHALFVHAYKRYVCVFSREPKWAGQEIGFQRFDFKICKNAIFHSFIKN